MTETEKLTWRAFAPEDFEAAARLLGRTWLPEFDEAAQRAASQIELAHYLAQATWSLVAEHDGEVLGVVLLAERGREVVGADGWSELEARLTRAAEKDEALAEAVRTEMGGVREEAELEREYAAGGPAGADAAVKLLIVSPDAKGMGLGGRLFSAALEHLREAGAAGYHLLTDDSCDVGFYEHKGLTQAMRRRSRAYWPGVDPETDEFYVYVYEQLL
ncbi:GNAT family N-acetyltransferase [Olsenella sp. DSM 107455]|uniref:GNAT family N-acetyltransferase n=1 Tax=Thermophilibacter gallinarum TaxID=2779357 RepID=A0ABR9QQH5_9ACTN|nr:GNAT family N-acetyltransferase [Thermophilibacter gallinarum]MBE5023331.1 GNAT family N-acetyltransferase [Thermophilibacter gallinarum]